MNINKMYCSKFTNPHTSVKWVNPSEERWQGAICNISQEDFANIPHPVVNLDDYESDRPSCPVYNLPHLMRWARVRNTWPHNPHPIDWDRIDSIGRVDTTRSRSGRPVQRDSSVAGTDRMLQDFRSEIADGLFNRDVQNQPVINANNGRELINLEYARYRESMSLLTWNGNITLNWLQGYWRNHPYSDDDMRHNVPSINYAIVAYGMGEEPRQEELPRLLKEFRLVGLFYTPIGKCIRSQIEMTVKL